MSAVKYISAEPWAIEPGALRLIASIATRQHTVPDKTSQEWQKFDYAYRAGPGVQRLAGAQRASAVDGVAIVPVLGPIFPRANLFTEISGATSISMLSHDFRLALQSPEIGAIMLLIDSPGGAVSGVQAFADLVAAGSARKKTVAFVAGTAASAAYWIASAAPEVAMDRTSMVGSIGVIAAIPKQVQPDSEGVIGIEIVSSNAPNKRPDPTSDDGAAAIRATLDAIEEVFIADVANGRKVTPATVRAKFGQGGVRVGRDAMNNKMADRVTSFEWTLERLKRDARDAVNQRKLQTLRR